MAPFVHGTLAGALAVVLVVQVQDGGAWGWSLALLAMVVLNVAAGLGANRPPRPPRFDWDRAWADWRAGRDTFAGRR